MGFLRLTVSNKSKLSAIRRHRKIDVGGFAPSLRDKLEKFSEPPKSEPLDEQERRRDLQSWTGGDAAKATNTESPEKDAFVRLKQQVEDWEARWHWWGIPALFIAFGQCAMFGVAVAPLLTNLGVSRFMFDCNDAAKVCLWKEDQWVVL